MKVDEEKQYELHKLEKNTATNEDKKIYSDHNSILINLDFENTNWRTKAKQNNNKKKGYKRHRTIIEKENVSKLLKSRDLHENYNNCSTATETSIKTVQRTKSKNSKKDIKGLPKFAKDWEKNIQPQ